MPPKDTVSWFQQFGLVSGAYLDPRNSASPGEPSQKVEGNVIHAFSKHP